MDLAVAEGRRRGIGYMILHATQMGRPLYDKLGWAQTAEMSIALGRPEGTLKAQVHRGLALLRAALEQADTTERREMSA